MESGMARYKKLMGIKPHIEVERVCEGISMEESARRLFLHRWGWLLDEYEAMAKELEVFAEKVELNEEVTEEEGRTILPMPRSMNHQYGWLCSKPAFNLEKYGPDIFGPCKIQEADQTREKTNNLF